MQLNSHHSINGHYSFFVLGVDFFGFSYKSGSVFFFILAHMLLLRLQRVKSATHLMEKMKKWLHESRDAAAGDYK